MSEAERKMYEAEAEKDNERYYREKSEYKKRPKLTPAPAAAAEPEVLNTLVLRQTNP